MSINTSTEGHLVVMAFLKKEPFCLLGSRAARTVKVNAACPQSSGDLSKIHCISMLCTAHENMYLNLHIDPHSVTCLNKTVHGISFGVYSGEAYAHESTRITRLAKLDQSTTGTC